jgi:hypothetical protein
MAKTTILVRDKEKKNDQEDKIKTREIMSYGIRMYCIRPYSNMSSLINDIFIATYTGGFLCGAPTL